MKRSNVTLKRHLQPKKVLKEKNMKYHVKPLDLLFHLKSKK